MEKSVILVGIDNSDHSFHALDWTLRYFFPSGSENSPFKLVVVHAKPFAAEIARLAGPGTVDVIPLVEKDLEVIATGVLQKAEQNCKAKSVNDAIFEVIEGNAKQVLCRAVEKYHACVLIVGSHGYGILKRTVLGSVSDYCAHNAQCSVTIVKMPPKIKV